MYAVVMAGGSGTRLWPASRVWRPKQFLSLSGGRSQLEETLALLKDIVPPVKILVAALEAQRDLVEPCLGRGMRAVYEPAAKGTAPCLGLAALSVFREAANEVIAALPADNLIERGEGFARALREAAVLAGCGYLATVATKPGRPAAQYGYIKPGAALAGHAGTFRLAAFAEKPSLERAEELCAAGWLWNAGVFAFRPDVLSAEIGRCQPVLADVLNMLAGKAGQNAYDETLAALWPTLPSISFERGILAKVPRQGVVLIGTYAWSDLGSWDAVRIAALKGRTNAVHGDAILGQSKGCYVHADGGRLVAVLGAEDMTVIDTPEALLVLGPGRDQEIWVITKFLEASGRSDLL